MNNLLLTTGELCATIFPLEDGQRKATTMNDPRRSTRITPRYIRNGKLICEKREAGKYTHTDARRMRRWWIEKIPQETAEGRVFTNPSGKNPGAGMWVFYADGRTPDDIFHTKGDAVRALQVLVYGEYTTEEDYNR